MYVGMATRGSNLSSMISNRAYSTFYVAVRLVGKTSGSREIEDAGFGSSGWQHWMGFFLCRPAITRGPALVTMTKTKQIYNGTFLHNLSSMGCNAVEDWDKRSVGFTMGKKHGAVDEP